SEPVRCATTRTGRGAPRTPASPGCQCPTSSRRWPTSRAAPARAPTRKANTNIMIAIAKGMTDDEVKAAADYFAAMKWTPWIKVVEAATVPKTRIAGGMFLKLDGGETEPIGS